MSLPWGTGLPMIKVYSDATQTTLQRTLYLPPPDKREVQVQWKKESTFQKLVDGSNRERVLGFVPVMSLKWKAFDDTSSNSRGLGLGQADGNMLTLADLVEVLALAPGRLRVCPGVSRATRQAYRQPFWVGDGSTPSAQIKGLVDGRLVSARRNISATIFRTDWQGSQQLYSTPRTNRWIQSAALGTSPNVQNGVTSTSAAGIAPDGTNTAFKVAEDGGNTIHCLIQSITYGAEQVTQSFWVKAAERTKCAISPGAGDGIYCYVDLTSGIITGINGAATAVIKDAGNGWWKVSVTYTASAGAKSARLYIVTVANSVVAYQGTAGSGILAWHPQNETGPAATSDIPTAAAAVSVTDYTLNSSGIFLPVSVPAVGAAFDWSGTWQDVAVGFPALVTKFPDYKPLTSGIGGDVQVEFTGRDILSLPILSDF